MGVTCTKQSSYCLPWSHLGDLLFFREQCSQQVHGSALPSCVFLLLLFFFICSHAVFTAVGDAGPELGRRGKVVSFGGSLLSCLWKSVFEN